LMWNPGRSFATIIKDSADSTHCKRLSGNIAWQKS
jgi:hypothetical protein